MENFEIMSPSGEFYTVEDGVRAICENFFGEIKVFPLHTCYYKTEDGLVVVDLTSLPVTGDDEEDPVPEDEYQVPIFKVTGKIRYNKNKNWRIEYGEFKCSTDGDYYGQYPGCAPERNPGWSLYQGIGWGELVMTCQLGDQTDRLEITMDVFTSMVGRLVTAFQINIFKVATEKEVDDLIKEVRKMDPDATLISRLFGQVVRVEELPEVTEGIIYQDDSLILSIRRKTVFQRSSMRSEQEYPVLFQKHGRIISKECFSVIKENASKWAGKEYLVEVLSEHPLGK